LGDWLKAWGGGVVPFSEKLGGGGAGGGVESVDKKRRGLVASVGADRRRAGALCGESRPSTPQRVTLERAPLQGVRFRSIATREI